MEDEDFFQVTQEKNDGSKEERIQLSALKNQTYSTSKDLEKNQDPTPTNMKHNNTPSKTHHNLPFASKKSRSYKSLIHGGINTLEDLKEQHSSPSPQNKFEQDKGFKNYVFPSYHYQGGGGTIVEEDS